VIRIPATGNETVLDAIGQVYGLSQVASRCHIWIARPSLGLEEGEDAILPVDWNAITRRGSSAANYEIVPGDRLFVEARPIICIDENIALYLAPLQRLMGATILAVGTGNVVKFAGRGGAGGLGGFGGGI